jgi:hypothetical protein
MSDKLIVKILDDGTLKIETDKVSSANHTNAEGLLRQMSRLQGGVEKIENKQGHHREHSHDGIHYHSHS